MEFGLTFLCLVLFFFCRYKQKETAKIIFIVSISIILIMLSGLRHESIGNDTINYIHMFENVKSESLDDITSDFFSRYINQSSNEDKDPGYAVFVKILQIIIDDVREYLFLVAILFYTSLGLFVKKYAKSILEVLFFYVFYINLFNGYIPNSAIRQTISISIILFAYDFLQNKEWYKYFLFVVLASFFHKSALICLILFPFSYIKRIDLIFDLSLLLFFVVLANINRVSSLLITSNDVYNGYLTENYYGNTNKPYVIIILMLGLYLIGLLGLKRDTDLIGNRLFYMGTIFTLLFSSLVLVNPSLLRIISYFAPLMGILVGGSFNRINQGKKLCYLVVLIFIISAVRSLGSYYFMWETVRVY